MRLGIIGGGQLAKMTAQAAVQLGCDVVLLERQPEFPARSVAASCLVKDWNAESLLELGSMVDVVTLENEFVSVEPLRKLEAAGHKLWPSAATLSLIQDKFQQKETLRAAGIPIARSEPVQNVQEVIGLSKRWGLPFVLKARRNAYDGKGNFTVESADQIERAWQRLGGASGNALYAEAFCAFERELAVMVTRSVGGESVCYPVVETVQRDHVCHIVYAPGAVSPGIAERATALARRAAEAVGAVGSFGVEMFLTRDGEVLVNELAPRVHNSGHYTIEACECSQFENHVRAVLGWPLGSPKMQVPAAVMINLLGVAGGDGAPQGMSEALAVPGAHIHVYGKRKSGAGRKMGHITAVGQDLSEALATAQAAADRIRFGVNDRVS